MFFFHFLVYLMNPIQIHRSNCCHCVLIQKWYFLDSNPIPLIPFSQVFVKIPQKRENVWIIIKLSLHVRGWVVLSHAKGWVVIAHVKGWVVLANAKGFLSSGPPYLLHGRTTPPPRSSMM